jgi:uncharacterized membrane protein
MGIVTMFFLGKALKDSKTGAIAAFITSINYFHILYSQEARFYSLLFLGSSLSYLFFIKSVKEQGKILNFILYSLATALTLYTHYYGLVVYASQVLIFLIIIIYNKSQFSFILKGSLFGILPFILFLPWIPQVLADNQIDKFWVEPPKPYFILGYFYQYFNKEIVTTLVFLYCIFLFIKNRKKIGLSRDVLIVLVLWILLGYTIPYLYSVLKIPLLVPRYTIIVLPAFIIMVSLGITSLNNPKIVTVILVTVTFSALFKLIFMNKYYYTAKKEQWREITTTMQSEHCNDCLYISDYYWYYNYYFKQFHMKDTVRSLRTTSDEDILKADSVWFLAGHVPDEAIQQDEPIFKKYYRREKQYSKKSAFAILYVKNKY